MNNPLISGRVSVACRETCEHNWCSKSLRSRQGTKHHVRCFVLPKPRTGKGRAETTAGSCRNAHRVACLQDRSIHIFFRFVSKNSNNSDRLSKSDCRTRKLVFLRVLPVCSSTRIGSLSMIRSINYPHRRYSKSQVAGGWQGSLTTSNIRIAGLLETPTNRNYCCISRIRDQLATQRAVAATLRDRSDKCYSTGC